jgi:hypothetical protein
MPIIKSSGEVNQLTVTEESRIVNQVESVEPEKKKREYKKKAPNRGGYRVGAGRKKGSTSKVTAQSILEELIKQTGKTFEEVLVEEFIIARNSNDARLVREYLGMMGNKVIADKQDVDITSNGETLGVQLAINGAELPDWQK